MSIIYLGVKAFASVCVNNYFRKITVIGLENIPKDGPVIVTGNHSNQFVDAFVILSRCPRNLSFCMAASSFTKPFVGYCAKKIEAIPVYRAEDSKFLGKGKLRFTDKTTLKGEDAQFITQSKDLKLGIHYLLLEDNQKLMVDKIISETEIKVKENKEIYEHYKDSIAPISNYFIIPKVDNSQLFVEAHQVLKQGKAICIFPEGTSHDRTTFIQLKAGVAFMSLGAMADHGCKNIKIISAGLSYFKRDQFRSEAVVEFGQPYEIPSEWGELYKKDKRQAIAKTLDFIEEHMKEVTLTAPSYKEYNCIKLVRDLYIPENANLTPKQVNDIGRRFSKSYEKFKDKTEVKRLVHNLVSYNQSLEFVGIEDNEVKEINYNYKFYVKKTIASFLLFHLYLLLTIPIIAVTSPFLWFVRKKAEKERIKAKAKNPYKILGLDVVSSVKITSFLKFVPAIFIIWILFVYAILNVYFKHLIPGGVSVYTTIVWATSIFPIYCFYVTYMIDSLFFYLETMKIRFLYFCYPKEVYKLKDDRIKLTYMVRDFVETNIDKSDYAKNRIVKPFLDNKKDRVFTIRKDKLEKEKLNEINDFLTMNKLN